MELNCIAEIIAPITRKTKELIIKNNISFIHQGNPFFRGVTTGCAAAT